MMKNGKSGITTVRDRDRKRGKDHGKAGGNLYYDGSSEYGGSG